MTVGIIGSGAMGAGIAQVVATAGHTILLLDKDSDSLARGGKRIKASLEQLTAKGKISSAAADEIYGRIQFTEYKTGFTNCNMVIEAIVEDLEMKQKVFKKLEDVVSPECILASNTSSLSIASIASACQHPERCIGIHFFYPAAIMKLVEITPSVQTKKSLVEEVKALISSWGKLPVVAKDTPGFIVNRVARPFYGEAIRILEEGIADCATIDWAMTELGSFKMGPFTLMDFIGNDVNYKVTESVFTSFFYDPRYKPSFTQKRLVEAGYYGQKTGKGFYPYLPDAPKPEPVRDEKLGHYILNRILAMLINEAIDAVALQVVSRDDLELAMTKGVNYPKGLLAWGEEWGLQNVLETIDALYGEYHEDRYRASPLLRKMVKSGQSFF